MMLAIYGPTATGKTALAIRFARKFNGELISADSRQVYKGLDIGTGKVTLSSKLEKHQGFWIVNGVKIHGFDLVKPGQNFSVADFIGFASVPMIHIIGKNRLPIIVGGTGFYIKALTNGINTIGIPKDKKLRSKLEKLSTEELFEKLKILDLQKAKSLNASDSKNPRRLIRAIEIAVAPNPVLTPGVSQAALLHTPGVGKSVNYFIIGLTAPNQYLYDRADNWLNTRLENGLIHEVERLTNEKVDAKWLENLGLEYRWITRFVIGEVTKEEAIRRLKGDIHSFIRRQKTWFRQFRQIKLYDISGKNWQVKLERDLKLWYTRENGRNEISSEN